MGEVYKATDTRLNRTVALKVLPSHLSSDPDLRRRFEREARAISSLSHPNICTLFDVGQHDGVEFLVMEYLEGQTLLDRLNSGPLPLEDVYRYAIDIADALDRAHRSGIVHRDLKPGNIVLTKSGAKLLDFGLAKWTTKEDDNFLFGQADQTTRRQPLTTAGMLLGTVPYMAPEQLEGKNIDARTDIFSFGAILYEMATGARAFSAGSNAALIAMLIHDDPPAPSTLATLPSRFDVIVQTCLRKDPNDRFQAAHDIRLELQWLAAGTTDPQPILGVETAAQRRLEHRCCRCLRPHRHRGARLRIRRPLPDQRDEDGHPFRRHSTHRLRLPIPRRRRRDGALARRQPARVRRHRLRRPLVPLASQTRLR